jgi:cell division septation protein DedD
MFRNKRLRRALPGGVIVVALVVVVMAGWRLFSRPHEEPIVSKTVAEKIVVTDPFTIQVAAYLKPEDAQRFVDQLLKKELDAFWTQAKSANRTWYQVKVSHFADRKGAQKYGQELKSKGLIDDFYVANYEHESRNSQ